MCFGVGFCATGGGSVLSCSMGTSSSMPSFSIIPWIFSDPKMKAAAPAAAEYVASQLERHAGAAGTMTVRIPAEGFDSFIEAIQPDAPPGRIAELDAQLRRYCRFDTEAMVEILKFFVEERV